MGSKPSSQSNSSQTYSPPPQVMANYQAVTNQAQNVAATPYQAYSGQLVAPVNGQQTSGINAINSASGIQNGYNAGATGLAAASSAIINPEQFSGQALGQYENPYQSQVVNATEAELQQQNQQQAAALQSQSIASGAFGGDRAGIAQAALAGQQDIANNATIAGLNSQNFQNAENEFNTQQATNLSAQQNTAARQLAASQQLGSLGNTAQGEALTEANAQTNAGTLQQTTQQAQDTAAYNQFLQQQAYPFQTTGWLANIVEGIGSQSGGTSTGQQTQDTSTGSAILGGLVGLGSFLSRGGRVNDEIRVPHKALGGGLVPYDDALSANGGLGAGTYVPTINLPTGHTMPNSGGMGGAQAPYPTQQGQSMSGVAKGVQGLGNAFENSSLGDSFNDFTLDNLGFAKGGLVKRDDGGGVGDDDLLAAATALPPPTTAGLLAAQYANQMPAPQQSATGLVSASPDAASPRGLAMLRTAMGAADQAPSANSSSAYGDIDAYGNAVPVPQARPAGLGLVSGMPDAGANGIAAAPDTGAPPSSSPAASTGNMWTAPAYSGAAPKGPAPDPADYPTTPQGQAAFIRDYSAYAGGGRGINTNFALGVAHAEGLNGAARGANLASTVDVDRNGNPFSFGAFQLNVRNGLGNLARASGIDPADPAQANAANKFAMDFMATHGTQPWKGDQAVMAYQGGRGITAAPAAEAINAATAQSNGGAGSTIPSDNRAPSGSGGLFGSTGTTADTVGLLGLHMSPQMRQGLLAGGLGMMAGTSRNPFVNIGQGALQGLGAYNQARSLESQMGFRQQQAAHIGLENQFYPQVTQADLAKTKADTGLAAAETGRAKTEAALQQKQLDWLNGGLDAHAAHQDQKAKVVSDAAEHTPTSPVTANAAPVVGGAGRSPSAPAASSPASASAATPASVAPSGSGKQLVPEDDPDQLYAAAKRAAMFKPAVAEALQHKADQIRAGNLPVHYTDGTSDAVWPAALEAIRQKKQVEASAGVGAKVQTDVWEANLSAKNEAAKDAETGQGMLSQAIAMRNAMFDPQTGVPKVNTGPMGPMINHMAAYLKQVGVSDRIIQSLLSTDPNNAQELEKFRTALGSESARQELPGSPVRVGEFQRYLQSVPSAEILPQAFRYLIDQAIIPKAMQQIGAYGEVRDLHPENGDDVQGKLFDYRQTHPWTNESRVSVPAPTAAIEHLRAHPELASQFYEKYGAAPLAQAFAR